MEQENSSRPESLYTWCCFTIAAFALIPPLVVFCYGKADAPLPKVVQEMRLSLYYPQLLSRDGQIGIDLYHSFIFAEAWSDGLSPYGPLPDRYFRNYSLGRAPVHPPFTYWIYRSLVPLGFPTVRSIHTIVKLAVFFLSIVAVLWPWRDKRILFPAVFVSICCIFFSPAGLSELERGQSELFVASAYMLVFATVFQSRALWPFLAGILASLKISSLLFLGPFALLALAAGRERFGRIALALAVMFVLLLLFFPYFPGFARSIIDGDLLAGGISGKSNPAGVSFALLLPFYVGKTVIIESTLLFLGMLFFFHGKEQRAGAFLVASFPLAVMLVLQGIGFRTFSWEYKSVEVLALLPGLYLWLRAVRIPPWFQRVVASLYVVLLITVSHLFPFRGGILLGGRTDMAWVYFVASCMFLFLAVIGMLYGIRNPVEYKKETV